MSVYRVQWIYAIFFLLPSCFAVNSIRINYEANSFFLDEKPFRYVSGSAHYFRMPHEYWRDRLRKMRAGGLNAVSTYVEWSLHEPRPGEFYFEGNCNITRFIKIAQEEGLYVILRPGPYICAERDMGGFPYWLLNKYPDAALRTSDQKYLDYVHSWMSVLLPKIAPLLYGNGGPIIMVQIENEYGLYHACDHDYNKWLRNLFDHYIQKKAILFTTDSPNENYFRCGKIPDVYATVDFGPESDVEKAFSVMRKFEPKGPLVNSEYYPGWLTHWGENMATKNTSQIVNTLRKMLSMGANVNFYMFYGGTNFGFTAGANFDFKYQSDITSYDYDAPISEDGSLTDKYFAIKEVLMEFLPTQNITVEIAEKGNYGELDLVSVASLMSPLVRKTLGIIHSNIYPLTFESLNQNGGYVLYETDLRKTFTTPQDFFIENFNDYANIYLDGIFQAALSREKKENKFTLKNITAGQTLSIIVENLGRINFGPLINEKKGILSNVTRDDEILDKWNMTGFELKTLAAVENCFTNPQEDCNNGKGFNFYMTTFVISRNSYAENKNQIMDSFLDVSHLTKGLVFVNNFNLGRYWSTLGPQYTIYVPGVYLKANPEKNSIIIMEENIKKDTIKIKFRKTPIFDYGFPK